MWGTDITSETDPHSAGLGFAVRVGRGLPRAATRCQPPRAGRTGWSCLVLDDVRSVALGNEPVRTTGGEVVGRVTSGGLGFTSASRSPTPGCPSTRGHGRHAPRPSRCSAAGSSATVTDQPLHDPAGERLRACNCPLKVRDNPLTLAEVCGPRASGQQAAEQRRRRLDVLGHHRPRLARPAARASARAMRACWASEWAMFLANTGIAASSPSSRPCTSATAAASDAEPDSSPMSTWKRESHDPAHRPGRSRSPRRARRADAPRSSSSSRARGGQLGRAGLDHRPVARARRAPRPRRATWRSAERRRRGAGAGRRRRPSHPCGRA